MKKLSSFFLMGTVALAGLGVMSSCSSDDLGNDSTTNPGETKAVKTQFALNIPRANGGTRMSEQNTQANKNFLGMQDIRMYSFNAAPAAGSTSTATFALANIEGITTTASSKIYSDVSVPVGTTHFLFYAHAPQGTTDAKKFELGVLDFTNPATDATQTSGISANLITVKKEDTTSPTDLLGILNSVAGVAGWADAATDTKLGNLYANFVKAKAGSANSIRLTLQSLYNSLGGVITSSNTAEKELAEKIRTQIAGSFKLDTGTDGYVTLAYKDGSAYSTYPNNINLPDGAVELSFAEATKKFSYAATSGLTGLSTLDASKICFPSAIYYFQSSDLAATAMELDASQWPTTTSKWVNESAPWLSATSTLETGWTSDVKATTRSIAMRQNINYGVANLATTVKCSTDKLPDNTGLTVTDPSEFADEVAVPAAGFPVSGLLIGGQPTKVGFNFQPATDDAFNLTIYDNALPTGIAAKNGAASTPNYTIVLPNDKGRTATDQNKVNVAIELTNNTDKPFRGIDGIIPVGGKFYLVGQLDPKNHNVTGVSNPAVFMSDYKTTLNLNITSLKSAYNTIPDLRSTKLQLGLSVDLEWQAGIQFDVNID